MLGAFQSFFPAWPAGWDSILVVWIHGTLEISAIIIAGGAGFILGDGILFPKTYSRLDSLKHWCQRWNEINDRADSRIYCGGFSRRVYYPLFNNT